MTQETSPISLKDKKRITLVDTARLILENNTLLIWFFIIIFISFVVTIFSFSFFTSIVERYSVFPWNNPLIKEVPEPSDSFVFIFWWIGFQIHLIISKCITFYFSFAISFAVASPFYAMLSTATEDILNNKNMPLSEQFNIEMLLPYIIASLKLSGAIFLISFLLFLLNFIPLFGQLVIFIIIAAMNAAAIMGIIFWGKGLSISDSIKWFLKNWQISLEIAFIPSFFALIPIINTFLMAFVVPFFIVHGTLAFLPSTKKNTTESNAS